MLVNFLFNFCPIHLEFHHKVTRHLLKGFIADVSCSYIAAININPSNSWIHPLNLMLVQAVYVSVVASAMATSISMARTLSVAMHPSGFPTFHFINNYAATTIFYSHCHILFAHCGQWRWYLILSLDNNWLISTQLTTMLITEAEQQKIQKI